MTARVAFGGGRVWIVMAVGLLAGRDLVAQRATDSTSRGVAAAVVEEYFAAYNAHDIEGIVELVDSSFVWLSVVGDSVRAEVRGREELARGLSDYFARFPDARSEVEAIVELGPWLSVRERAHWKSNGEARSQAALAVYEIRHGRVRRVWYYPVVP
jgi:hypothetical protein